MLIHETELKDAFVIEPPRFDDERGFFARAWSEKDFAAHGITTRFVEGNISFSRRRGVLRGMHFQVAPHAQAKLVRCTRGSIYDVAIDLRPDSPTYRRWTSVRLSADNRLAFLIPEGFAHGFQTLEDETEVHYLVSNFYAPESARGVRWDDPAFGVVWPDVDERVIIERDRSYPDFDARPHCDVTPTS